MTGLEAIWIPMVAGAVTGGGVAAAKGGKFGDIAKGAGLGAAGGAVTGGLASGLGGLAGAAPASTTANTLTGVSGAQVANTATTPNLGVDTSMPTINQQPLLSQQVAGMQLPETGKQSLMQMYNQPQQPATDTKKDWTTADYINATSSAANLAANIAQSPETPQTPIAPMPAIFSGQGGDLMQQLSQLSQG